ncbi:hypothetical protein FA13DRAFT_1734946 [Coprinellus micaceus]|uniref:Fungal-type protein kinase domain-containing protein n=1 Tax=Coprinellus micaceus TaxID=71717 RepID=A0A4Y7T568_COPMI|nr:hypothetical protein FA13DRAFT_1734946 [Coprinellus micaceus]
MNGQNIIRSATPGSDWTRNELLAYNIQVSLQEAPQFFGREHEPIDHKLDANLLSTADPTIAADLTKETYRFLAYLDLASHANSGQESAIDDFAKALGTVLRTRYDIPFTICGRGSAAKTDVCLVHLNSMILLVLQDKTNKSPRSPEAQVIAGAIAAFQYNNEKRVDRGLPPLDLMNIPCVTMIGTHPSFYKVPVTQELSDAVISGQYPNQPTIVTRCVPPPRRRSFEGMEFPDYRRIALQCYSAFRSLAKDCWAEFAADF